jgi:hypothetical protein
MECGAAAVIVGNHDSQHPNSVFAMHGTLSTKLTLALALVSKNSCDALLSLLEAHGPERPPVLKLDHLREAQVSFAMRGMMDVGMLKR